MNINVPPRLIQRKVDNDEDYFGSTNQKYSKQRLHKLWRKVKESVRPGSIESKSIDEVNEISIAYDSEDY